MSDLSLNDYQNGARKTAIYPKQATGDVGQLVYPTLGLASEAGEIAGKVKKIMRDKQGVLTEADRLALMKELGDVLWYVAAVATELGVTLEAVAAHNLEKLQGRAAAGTLQGSGDNR